MANVFISYSRKDKDFVRTMHEALEARGLDSWVDWEGIPPTADWLNEIYSAIESSDTFVAVLSPDSAASEVCKLEVQRAARHNKRIMPVICRDVDPREVPLELARHNWLFLRPSDPFEEGIETLVNAINTDLDWVRSHTRLLVRASEWESNVRDPSFLIRGAELREAEKWLSQAGAEKVPGPTALHARFILASRKAERGRLRLLTVVAVLGMLVSTLLAFFALSERNQAVHEASVRATAEAVSESRRLEAEQQQKIAVSRQLAAQALSQMDRQLDLSMLLSVEANQASDTVEAKGSLLQALQYSPHMEGIIRGSNASVESVATSFSLLASGGDDDTIRLWDPDTGQQVGQPIYGLSSPVMDLAFSPDGEILASSSLGGSIILWSVGTHKPIGQPLEWFGNGLYITFSPDGTTLYSYGPNNNIILWDLSASPPISQSHQVQAPVYALGITPEGKAIAAASWGHSIILWDIAADKQMGNTLIQSDKDIINAEFSPNGKLLASSDADGTITLWDVETQKAIGKPLTGQSGASTALAFSHDGAYLASASQTNGITIWQVGPGVQLNLSFRGHSDLINGIAFSLDNNHLFSASKDETLVRWNITDTRSLGMQLEGGPGYGNTFSVAFSADGKLLASGIQDNSITIWDTESDSLGGPALKDHTGWVRTVAFSPDSKLLASGSEDKYVSFYSHTNDNSYTFSPYFVPIQYQPLPFHTNGVLSVAFSPDGKLMASASRDKSIVLWDPITEQPMFDVAVDTLVERRLLGHKDTVTSVAFSPDGKLLASGSWDKTVILWDVATRKPVGEPLKGHTGDIWSVAFSPNGKILASAGEDRTIIFWDVATRKPIGQPLTGHTNVINSIAFSPDGKTLASGSDDGTIGLWDVATRLEITPPLTWIPPLGVREPQGVSSVAFSPDGKTLAAGGDYAPILWDVSVGSWQERACAIAARNMTQEEWQRYLPDVPYRKTCPKLP